MKKPNRKFLPQIVGVLAGGALLLANGLCLAASGASPASVTAQDLNQNLNNYLGKQVVLSGRIEKMLGNGAYMVSDLNSAKDSAHRILVFTAAPSDNNSKSKQQAGVVASNLKEGDHVQLNGKAEQFNVSSEVDTFSPKMNSETIDESATAIPIVVIQPGSMHRS